jgi:hypothetical protein
MEDNGEQNFVELGKMKGIYFGPSSLSEGKS